MISRLFVALVALTLAACAPLAPRDAGEARMRPQLAVERIDSPNYDARRPSLVVIHHTSNDTLERALQTLTSAERRVSAHYLIGRDGRLVQLVDERDRAWHAGKSWWGGVTDVNSLSIGIELDNNGFESFAEAQIEALLALLADIAARYPIPAANYVGHADVAPGRKTDPSAFFPWQRLAEQGFGLWCAPPYAPESVAAAGGGIELLLTALGYDPATPEASLAAFRLHYSGGETLPADEELALADCLLRQKRAAAP